MKLSWKPRILYITLVAALLATATILRAETGQTPSSTGAQQMTLVAPDSAIRSNLHGNLGNAAAPTGESVVRRLPPVSSVRRRPDNKITRLFPKPTVDQRRMEQVTAASARMVAGPTPANEPTPAEPELQPTPLDAESQPALLTRHEARPHQEDISSSNMLLNPLSGDCDFTESMSAIRETGEGAPDIDPSHVGETTLPEPLVKRVEEILAGATSLADRGALFAARREFLRALRMTARALDTRLGRPYHSQALANGLRALEEADDFSLEPSDSAENDLRLGNYVKGHRTPVLKQNDPLSLTPLKALQSYFEYAREQFTVAGGGSPLAAQALYAMGRAEMLLSSSQQNGASGAPKSLAYFHAALTIDPHNAPAGNELGVILARRGRLTEAAELLARSVASAPTPEALENLATVYEQLGDSRSPMVRHKALQVAHRFYGVPQVSSQPIVWLDPQTFGGPGPDQLVAEPAARDIRMSQREAPSGPIPAEPIATFASGSPIQPATQNSPTACDAQPRERFWW